MLGHVNFNLVPNRLPETSEGLYEGFEDDDEDDGWGSEDQGSQDSNEEEEGPNAAMTVGEEDGDDVDAMDVSDTASTNGIEGRGQKRSLEETES
jgi:hypothetical protein